MKNTATAVEKVSIRKVGACWMVIVQDAPSAQYPSVPRHHTAGVYYTQTEAIALCRELTPAA